MSSIKEIRESPDVKLTKLASRADAFQATLEKSKDHAERIQPNQQEVRRALDQLKAGVDRHKDLSDGRKQAIHSLVDTLNAQIAASATASRETLAYARQQIHEASRRLETELDGALAESKERVDELLQTAINTYGRAVDKLDAELEAAELSFASAGNKENTALDDEQMEGTLEALRHVGTAAWMLSAVRGLAVVVRRMRGAFRRGRAISGGD